MADRKRKDLRAPDAPWHDDDTDTQETQIELLAGHESAPAVDSPAARLMGSVQDMVDRVRGYAGEKISEVKEPLKETVGEAAGDLIVEGSIEAAKATGKIGGKVVKESVLFQDDPKGYLGRRIDGIRDRFKRGKETVGGITEAQLDRIRAEHDRLQRVGAGDYVGDIGSRTAEHAAGLSRRVQETFVHGLEGIAAEQSFHPRDILVRGSDIAVGTYRQGNYLTKQEVESTKAFVLHLEDDPEFHELAGPDLRRQVLDLYIGFAVTEADKMLEAGHQNPTLGGRAQNPDLVERALALVETSKEFFEIKQGHYSTLPPGEAQR